MHILHTVPHTLLEVLTKRICVTINGFLSCWSFPLFSRPYCMIQGWYCREKLDACHSLLGVEGLKDQEEELEKTNPTYVSRISPLAERRQIANARTSAFESKPFTLSTQLIKKPRYHVIPISPSPPMFPTDHDIPLVKGKQRFPLPTDLLLEYVVTFVLISIIFSHYKLG